MKKHYRLVEFSAKRVGIPSFLEERRAAAYVTHEFFAESKAARASIRYRFKPWEWVPEDGDDSVIYDPRLGYDAIGERVGIPFPLTASDDFDEYSGARNAYEAWLLAVGECLVLEEIGAIYHPKLADRRGASARTPRPANVPKYSAAIGVGWRA
jgi:hypothetical protein